MRSFTEAVKVHELKAIPLLAAQSNSKVQLAFLAFKTFCVMQVLPLGSSYETHEFPKTYVKTLPLPTSISGCGIQAGTNSCLKLDFCQIQ